MDTTTLRRLSGVALIAAGPLCILGGVLHPVINGHAHSSEALLTDHAAGSLALLAGEMLLVLGLPGVYGWLAPRLGITGLIGFVLYIVGNVLSAIPHLVIMGFAGHTLAEKHPDVVAANDWILPGSAFAAEQLSTALAFMIGLLLFGIALLRADGVPKLAGVLAVGGAIAPFLPLPAVQFLTGLQIETLRGLLLVALGVLAIRPDAAWPSSSH